MQDERTVQEKPIDNSSYPFNDEHHREWNMGGNSFPTDTPIARAWARLYDRGIDVGAPVGPEYDASFMNAQGRRVPIVKQRFQNAVASTNTWVQDNPNQMVEFSDARGIVGTDVGL